MTEQEQSPAGHKADTESYPDRLQVNDELELRLSSSADVDRLQSWTQDPDVYKWWEGRPLERGEIEEKYTGRRLPEVIAYIVEKDKEPIGFIQAWQEDGKQGLDMFLSSAAQGHGLGSTVANALAADLSERGWSNLTVDPAVENEKAIRSWARAGFTPNGAFGEDDGRKTQIMVFKPHS
jgi:aminoglycoside 6'-N-acetyltransferase